MNDNKELWIALRRALLSIIATPTRANILRALKRLADAIAKEYALEREG